MVLNFPNTVDNWSIYTSAPVNVIPAFSLVETGLAQESFGKHRKYLSATFQKEMYKSKTVATSRRKRSMLAIFFSFWKFKILWCKAARNLYINYSVKETV
jgi:hypothetical protein